LVESLPLESSFREDLIFYLKRILISDFALRNNFKKVLFGTGSHKIACTLMNAICKGRGSSIAHEIAFIDDKNFGGRISFMNPLRDFLEKEIALYNYNMKV
jgi:tRNA(Ile)-lysidine synthase TilS/MesJ